jgi:hypothetical protein
MFDLLAAAWMQATAGEYAGDASVLIEPQSTQQCSMLQVRHMK